ncbi:MAG: SGNH/GDSL hydrolase family protein [Lachnospiraceae bacterium]|nr:SGNH/GDSL hydrolase family protein [Lachnospiraceae bacterium]
MNRKKIGKVLLAGLTAAFLLGGCGLFNSGKMSTEEYMETLFAECSYVTPEMYERATSYSQGDLSRLADVMRRARAGEDITIGVIGGSITQGYSSSDMETKCYAALLRNWWEETFPDSKITYINAGVGGTSSYLGVHRVYEDLLVYEPDFVVVEFSVNDGNGNFYKKSYENLLRRILTSENEPAVMLLFMTMEDGTSAQDTDAAVGFAYNLPMLSYRNAVLDEIKAGSFTWADISPDNIHPNDRGHAIVGELFDLYLSSVYYELDEMEEEVAPFTASVITKEVYMDAVLLDSQDIVPDALGSFVEQNVDYTYPNDWYTESGEEGICFTVEAANIGIMYQRFKNRSGGQYEVYIDGEYTMTLDADFANGWGNSIETTEVYTSSEKATHTIEIKKKEDSEGSVFALLGLLIS